MKPQRLLFFVAIIAGVLLALKFFAPPKTEPKPEEPVTQTTTQPTTTATSAPAAPARQAKTTISAPTVPAVQWMIKPGQKPGCMLGSLSRGKQEDGKKTPNDYLLQVTLRSEGAAVESVHLTNYFQTVADKRLFEKLEKDEARYAEEAAKNPEKYKGHYAVISPVIHKDCSYYSLAAQNLILSTGPKNGNETDWPMDKIGTRKWHFKSVTETDTTQSAVFEWPVYRSDNLKTPAVTIRKTYTVTRGSYSIDVALECINHTKQPLRLRIDQSGPIGVTQEDPRADQRMVIVARLENNGEIQRQDLPAKQLGESAYGQDISLGRSDAKTDPVLWMAYVNKFFGSILYLQPKTDTLNAASVNAQFYVRPVQQNDEERMWETSVQLHDIELAPDGSDPSSRMYTWNLFAGPKTRQLFKDNPLYAQLHYSETINQGSCGWCTFTWLTDALMWLLNFFSTFLFDNFGLAIILLVIIVRILLHPLMKYSQVSMAKMQKSMAALKPQMEQIRQKYANDKATQQREMLKLQKEAGVGPGQMLGCLPMLLQMPIWIALYTGLNTEVALRHAAFLPVWITDLAAPDHLFSFGRELPLVGEYFNLLPILLTVAMFLSMKMNPAAAAQNSSPEQKQQQMMMKLMMPIMMLFFFYNAPSGLTLYIMASTFAGVAESYYIRRHIKEREEMEAATETVVKVSGKGPRAARPKKPKGPFWTKRG